LNSGVNFINVLQAAFVCADPESAKKTVKLLVFFALSGSALAKAVLRTLMKLNTDVTLCFFMIAAQMNRTEQMLQMANRTLSLKANSSSQISQRKNNFGLSNFLQNPSQTNNNVIAPSNESKSMTNTVNSVPSQSGNTSGNRGVDLNNNQSSKNTNIAAPSMMASIPQSNVPNNTRRKRSLEQSKNENNKKFRTVDIDIEPDKGKNDSDAVIEVSGVKSEGIVADAVKEEENTNKIKEVPFKFQAFHFAKVSPNKNQVSNSPTFYEQLLNEIV